MKNKKGKGVVPLDPFDYEEADFTPAFFIAVGLTIIAMVIVIFACGPGCPR